MFNWFDNMLIALKVWAGSFVNEVKENESGIDGFVAAVVLILIVVLLAALLYTFLGDWFADIWERITGATDSIT